MTWLPIKLWGIRFKTEPRKTLNSESELWDPPLQDFAKIRNKLASDQGLDKFAPIAHSAGHVGVPKEGCMSSANRKPRGTHKYTESQFGSGISGGTVAGGWEGNCTHLSCCYSLQQASAHSPRWGQAAELDRCLLKVQPHFLEQLWSFKLCDGNLLGGDRWLFQGILAGCH